MTTTDNSQTQNNTDECSICLSSLTQSNLDVFTTACKHQFHFECLTKSILAQNNECPLCRTRLESLVNILTAASNANAPALAPAPAPIQPVQIQTMAPIQPVQIQTVAPIQTVPPANSTGMWASFTRSLRNTLGWNSNASTTSTRPTSSMRQMTRQSLSNIPNDFSSLEDVIDEEAVRELAARINAARQQSSESHNEAPLITATTTLEFGGQESTKESNIFGMLSLKAASLLSEKATEKELDELHVPIDLVCVVDQSGSMQGDKIALLKHTLNYIVDQMGPLDRLAIISFDTRAFNRTNGLKLMTTDKKQIVRDAIRDNIRADGGTYIGSGLEMAIQLLRARQKTNPIGSLLLLTDGQDNQPHDYSILMQSLPEDVVCHTFGYGSNHNAALLSRLAEEGHGGTFTYVDRFDAIGPAFATALGGLFTCIAKRLRIKLEFYNEYRITHVHTTYSYEPTALPSNQVIIKMTDLNADESRNLVFQLHVPKIVPSDENNINDHVIGRVSLEYIDANTDRTINTTPVSFTIARPNQISPDSPLLQVNYALDVQRNRAETSLVLKQAVEQRDFQRARDIINAQLAKIRSSVSAQDSLCQQLIRDLEYQYSSQVEFQTTMTNMYMQHGQERATYSTNATTSAACFMTMGQERYRKKLFS